MVLFNYATKELTAKVVYYGPGLCGKTTNLQWIHEKLPIKNKGKMLSLATETDRTLFFDFLPIELGNIRGMKTRIQLYTVPGQVFYNATRRMVLKGADCVVFVCDSQEAMLEPNLESLENLRQNLEANEIDPNEIPMVLQFNKRDLPNALPIEILNERLNARGVPFHEAVALKGTGVEDTLKSATGLVFRSLAQKYGSPEVIPSGTGLTPSQPIAAGPRPAPGQPGPTPPRAGSATLPPLNMQPAQPAEELLESLELQPAPDDDEAPVVGDQELDLESGGEPAIEVEMESLHVDSGSELSLDPPSPPPPARRNPRETLVSNKEEVAELRRRIARPSLPELDLEQLEAEEAEIDEIPLEVELPAAPAPPPSPPPRPAASPAAIATLPPEPRSGPAPPVQVAATPVAVQLQGTPGQATVAIPIEVKLQNGSATVSVRLQVTLNLKVSS